MVYVKGLREGQPLVGDPNAPPHLTLWYCGLFPEACSNYAFCDARSMTIWTDCIDFYERTSALYPRRPNRELEISLMSAAVAEIDKLESHLGAEWLPLDIRFFRDKFIHHQRSRGSTTIYHNCPQPPQPITVTVFHPCARCGKCATGNKRCSRCKKVYYCSKSCQRLHWKSGHKQDCATNEKQRTEDYIASYTTTPRSLPPPPSGNGSSVTMYTVDP